MCDCILHNENKLTFPLSRICIYKLYTLLAGEISIYYNNLYKFSCSLIVGFSTVFRKHWMHCYFSMFISSRQFMKLFPNSIGSL